MGEIRKNIVLLLTGTINPNSRDILSVTDPEIRKKQYLEAIFFYLDHTDYDIVFTENSGTSILENFERNERIEFLSYRSPFTIPDKGKGWKELEIIDFSLKNSKFIHAGVFVLKITGRLKLLNINQLAKQVRGLNPELSNYVLCNIYKPFKMDSRSFLFTLDFWPTLQEHGQLISQSYSFERALWKAICEYDMTKKGEYSQFSQPLQIEGISGGLGITYKNGGLISLVRRIRHFFLKPWVYNRFRKKSL